MNRRLSLLVLWSAAISLVLGNDVLACDRCGLAFRCFHPELQQVHGLQAGAEGDVQEEDLAAFRVFGSGWTNTSSGTSGLGRPAELTWSIVPDDTVLPTGLGEPASNSNLIEFLDSIHHSEVFPQSDDLTDRAWWHLFNSSFERWDELSGISFNYEPNDDGRRLGAFNGALGTRGDHRIGGHSIDGQTSPTFLAYNFFPNNSDMVIDTDEINRWSNSTDNYLLFRNMITHEIGHGIGLNHVEPVNQSKLMEPRISTAFDGPQLDDILGAHRLYGDANEDVTGNDFFTTATPLGTILKGQTLSIGTDATDPFVSPDETDFVSIDDDSDVDYFSFSVEPNQLVSIWLTPMGPTYREGSNANNATDFDAAAQSDLTLTLVDSNGTTVRSTADDTGLGMTELIRFHQLGEATDYFVRVGGKQNAAQFFQLDIIAIPEPTSWLLLGMATLVAASQRRR